MIRVFVVGLAAAIAAGAQSRPPVVLLNGYQGTCQAGATSAGTFDKLQSLLEAEGLTVYFFDNCAVADTGSSRPGIEQLGQAFGAFLVNIPAPQVDVVAHSMGGLIVRAYLEGMLPSGGFAPPADTRIRKAVFIGTPNFGALALVYSLLGKDMDTQLDELVPASEFEWRLNTANQGSYDFRGVDVISILGNSAAPGESDGAVPLTSASLAQFFGPQEVRVIPGCHVPGFPPWICDGPGIAYIDSTSHPSFRIIDSFLAGTNDWQSIGHSAAQDPVLSKDGGINVAVEDENGAVSTAIKGMSSSAGSLAGNALSGVFFGDLLSAGQYSFSISGAAAGTPAAFSFAAQSGYEVPVVVKNGPRIDAVSSATGPLQTLSRAPGMLVSIYGAALGKASVTVASKPVSVLYASDSQINAILPADISGVVPVLVASASGSHTVSVFIQSVVPALFAGDDSGAALAFHADGSAVSASTPAAAGETISVYATGVDLAPGIPVLLNGNAAGAATAAPFSPGVDLVTLTIPAGLAAGSATLAISYGALVSNTVTLAVRGD